MPKVFICYVDLNHTKCSALFSGEYICNCEEPRAAHVVLYLSIKLLF